MADSGTFAVSLPDLQPAGRTLGARAEVAGMPDPPCTRPVTEPAAYTQTPRPAQGAERRILLPAP